MPFVDPGSGPVKGEDDSAKLENQVRRFLGTAHPVVKFLKDLAGIIAIVVAGAAACSGSIVEEPLSPEGSHLETIPVSRAVR